MGNYLNELRWKNISYKTTERGTKFKHRPNSFIQCADLQVFVYAYLWVLI